MANLVEGEWELQNPTFVGARNKSRLAEALRRQAGMPQGQMVGDRFVAPSITQFLASGFNQYRANQLDNEANQSIQDAYANRQRIMQEAASRYAQALAPKQVQIGEQKLPYEPNQMDRFGSPTMPQSTQPILGTRGPSIEDMLRAQMAYAQEVQDPRMLQNIGNSMLQYGIGQQQREDTQAFQRQQAEENRAQRMQELMMRMQDQQASRAEQLQARKELAQMQIDARREMYNLAQANRPQSQAQLIDTPQGKMQIVNGKAVPLLTAEGKPVIGAKSNAPLSATAQKELFEAEDVYQASNNALGMLKEALVLNKKAYSGYGAKPRAIVASNIGLGGESADATVNLDNLMTGQALESLKATFGGMPTEGERKILLEMQASVDKTPSQRQTILERAIKAAENRAKFNLERAKALRSGDYFTDYSVAQPQNATIPSIDAINAELARRGKK